MENSRLLVIDTSQNCFCMKTWRSENSASNETNDHTKTAALDFLVVFGKIFMAHDFLSKTSKILGNFEKNHGYGVGELTVGLIRRNLHFFVFLSKFLENFPGSKFSRKR
uniref:Versican core protein n=1 Tax=Lygus hesperus TaxID=30085 RepID=A0A0A9XG14_LYGHE